jgi:hypothetical protein
LFLTISTLLVKQNPIFVVPKKVNIQKTIIKCISEQLFLNNYLVVPNFGGFVLKTTSSQIYLNGSKIIPPTKRVSFNAQLKQNDGVLALCLQKKLNCSSAEALHHLSDFASYCLGILNSSKRISFEEIGFFYTDFENNICFEPQTNTNFLTSSFGLTTLPVKVIVSESTPLKKQPIFIDKTPVKATQKQTTKPRLNYYSKVVVPITTVIIVFTLLALFISKSKFAGQLKASILGHSDKMNYSPLNYSNLILQSTITKNNTYIADANGIASITLENLKTILVNVNTSLTTKNLAVETKNITPIVNSQNTNSYKNNTYKIVLGCFSIISNAERLNNILQGQNISANVTIGVNKLYIVSYGNFKTKEEAFLQLARFKNNYPKAWIKKTD